MSEVQSFVGYFEVLEVFDEESKIKIFSDNNLIQVDNESCVPCPVHGASNGIPIQTDNRNIKSGQQLGCGYCSCDVGCSCIFPIDSQKLIRVGRDKECDLILDHPATSLLHFVLWTVHFDPQTRPISYIMDKSRNGVYINSTLLGRGNIHILRDYDIIVVKRAVKLSYRMLENDENVAPFPYKRELGDWLIGDLLVGSGSYGEVFVASKRNNSKNFAVKIIKNVKNKNMTRSERERLKNESKILMKINHFNIIKVHDAIMVDSNFYIFEDLISGGDLFSYMFKGNTLWPLSESETILIVFQLLKALDHLHNSLNIIHRDLKLDNVLLSLPVPGARIYLCDFGIAKAMASSFQRANTIVGTVEYSAPEVFYKSADYDTKSTEFTGTHKNLDVGYNFKCDMWSLGVMIYIILTGISPFFSNEPSTIIQKAREGKIDLDKSCFSKTSSHGKDFLSRLLQVDPERRMTVEDCFKHNWITKNSEFLNKVYNKLQDS